MESEEADSISSSAVSLPDSFKDPQISQSWRPHTCYEISSLLRHKNYAQKIRKRRKPVVIKYKPRMQKVHDYDHPMPAHNVQRLLLSKQDSAEEQAPQVTRFQKREITTIHEEVFQYSKTSDKLRFHSHHNRFSKGKGYNEKVASLKLIVGRLQKMCLEKPSVLQSNIPEETIMLFKAVHI